MPLDSNWHRSSNARRGGTRLDHGLKSAIQSRAAGGAETAVVTEGARGDRSGPNYPAVGLLSLAHFTNDLYGNLLSSIMPYLVLRGNISATAAGFVILVYLLGSSFLQPAFG